MSMIQEFKEFAMRGNVVDLAVGVIMGAAFAPIVSTLVEKVIMPQRYARGRRGASSILTGLPTMRATQAGSDSNGPCSRAR